MLKNIFFAPHYEDRMKSNQPLTYKVHYTRKIWVSIDEVGCLGENWNIKNELTLKDVPLS